MIKKLKTWVIESWKSAHCFQALKIFCLSLITCIATTSYLEGRPIDVFAAASLKEPIDELSASYSLKTGVNVRVSYASSSVLARQIQYGAPADVFISANLGWMEYLDGQGVLLQHLRSIAFNRIIFASRSSEALDLNAASIVKRLAGGKLAIPLIDAVPLGLYAGQALQNLGLLDELKPHMVFYDNARSSLIPVLHGEVELGIIYASDLTLRPDLHMVAEIPQSLHDKITYVAAPLEPRGTSFVKYLLKPEANVIFKSYGFSSP